MPRSPGTRRRRRGPDPDVPAPGELKGVPDDVAKICALDHLVFEALCASARGGEQSMPAWPLSLPARNSLNERTLSRLSGDCASQASMPSFDPRNAVTTGTTPYAMCASPVDPSDRNAPAVKLDPHLHGSARLGGVVVLQPAVRVNGPPHGRGVDVRVLVPSMKIDIRTVYFASRARYAVLLACGVRLYEYQPTMMHAKTMVVDGIWTTIGSSNFDDRSFRLNDEVNVNIYDEGIAAQMEQMFFEDLARSEEITRPRFLKRPWGERVKEWFADWLKPQL